MKKKFLINYIYLNEIHRKKNDNSVKYSSINCMKICLLRILVINPKAVLKTCHIYKMHVVPHSGFSKLKKETLLGFLAYRMEKLACQNLLKQLTNNAKENPLMHSPKLSNFG